MAYSLVIIIALVVLGFVYYFNRLVRLRNQADESWSGIDVQLKRRFDLIPNLVEVVKGYAGHEKATLEKVVQLRGLAQQAQTGLERSAAESSLGTAVSGVLALSEAYPDLKANQNFLQLQKDLAEIEDHLQNARRYYNAVVRDFNTLCESFPSLLVANLLHFKTRPFFIAEAADRSSVKVALAP